MYILKFVISILLIIMLWVVVFLSISLLMKLPGNKKLKSKFETEECIRKEKAQFKKFLKVYIVTVVVLVVLLLLVLYIYFT